jgi:hypothetical protein
MTLAVARHLGKFGGCIASLARGWRCCPGRRCFLVGLVFTVSCALGVQDRHATRASAVLPPESRDSVDSGMVGAKSSPIFKESNDSGSTPLNNCDKMMVQYRKILRTAGVCSDSLQCRYFAECIPVNTASIRSLEEQKELVLRTCPPQLAVDYSCEVPLKCEGGRCVQVAPK